MIKIDFEYFEVAIISMLALSLSVSCKAIPTSPDPLPTYTNVESNITGNWHGTITQNKVAEQIDFSLSEDDDVVTGTFLYKKMYWGKEVTGYFSGTAHSGNVLGTMTDGGKYYGTISASVYFDGGTIIGSGTDNGGDFDILIYRMTSADHTCFGAPLISHKAGRGDK